MRTAALRHITLLLATLALAVLAQTYEEPGKNKLQQDASEEIQKDDKHDLQSPEEDEHDLQTPDEDSNEFYQDGHMEEDVEYEEEWEEEGDY